MSCFALLVVLSQMARDSCGNTDVDFIKNRMKSCFLMSPIYQKIYTCQAFIAPTLERGVAGNYARGGPKLFSAGGTTCLPVGAFLRY
jgi:hypothetical protein